jgi:hypothetical protein
MSLLNTDVREPLGSSSAGALYLILLSPKKIIVTDFMIPRGFFCIINAICPITTNS